MKKLFREPIIVFFLIGGAFYLLHGWVVHSKLPDDKQIVITANQIEQLSTQFTRTWMRDPTKSELTAIIENQVRDEVYYREALMLDLDKNDQVIHRRMRQKLEMLMDNMASANVPSDQMLTTFMQENAEDFRVDHQVAFMHVYLNPDKHQDMDADARILLTRLQSGARPEQVGDLTLLGYEFELSAESEISRQFGAEFTKQLIEKNPGEWTGPIYSGLGTHLVKIIRFVEGRMPELREIRNIVEREWMAKRTKELKDAAYVKLLEGYDVVVEEKGAGE